MHKVGVHPARHRYYSPQLATMAVGVHGYRGECTCGWRGDVRENYATALSDSHLHRRTVHVLPWEVVDDTPPSGATD